MYKYVIYSYVSYKHTYQRKNIQIYYLMRPFLNNQSVCVQNNKRKFERVNRGT